MLKLEGIRPEGLTDQFKTMIDWKCKTALDKGYLNAVKVYKMLAAELLPGGCVSLGAFMATNGNISSPLNFIFAKGLKYYQAGVMELPNQAVSFWIVGPDINYNCDLTDYPAEMSAKEVTACIMKKIEELFSPNE